MLPSFRIVAYYHPTDNEVVSDSVWVDVKDSCMGSVSLTPLRLQVKIWQFLMSRCLRKYLWYFFTCSWPWHQQDRFHPMNHAGCSVWKLQEIQGPLWDSSQLTKASTSWTTSTVLPRKRYIVQSLHFFLHISCMFDLHSLMLSLVCFLLYSAGVGRRREAWHRLHTRWWEQQYERVLWCWTGVWVKHCFRNALQTRWL